MPDAPLISARGLCRTFGDGRSGLSHIDLTVRTGEFVSIVGPSGCGKSTLLRLIAGLLEPSAGSLTIGGSAPSGSSLRSAFVFQEPNLLPWRTVTGNVRLPLELHPGLRGSDRKTATASVHDTLRLVGLHAGDFSKRPRQLSGGMRMRVSLARALVTGPSVLLLDEPFAALDDILRQQLNEELQRIWCRQNWTALFVTHNVSEAVFLSQRVLVMSRGPGRLIGEVEVPFEFPRPVTLRSDAAFARLTGEVSAMLRQAVEDVA